MTYSKVTNVRICKFTFEKEKRFIEYVKKLGYLLEYWCNNLRTRLLVNIHVSTIVTFKTSAGRLYHLCCLDHYSPHLFYTIQQLESCSIKWLRNLNTNMREVCFKGSQLGAFCP